MNLTIDLYTYGESNLRVAVEYSQGIKKESKKSNKYFAFDNPKLQMITNGKWEIDIYPHLPHKYKPKDIKFIYYIKYIRAREKKLKKVLQFVLLFGII